MIFMYEYMHDQHEEKKYKVSLQSLMMIVFVLTFLQDEVSNYILKVLNILLTFQFYKTLYYARRNI